MSEFDFFFFFFFFFFFLQTFDDDADDDASETKDWFSIKEKYGDENLGSKKNFNGCFSLWYHEKSMVQIELYSIFMKTLQDSDLFRHI